MKFREWFRQENAAWLLHSTFSMTAWRRKWFMWFLRWASDVGIHVIAGIAFITLVATTLIGNNDWGFKVEPNDRPIFYDLSLGILAAYFFNLLVITIPRYRQRRETYALMIYNLTQLVRSGHHLLRSLELISRSPRCPKFNRDHFQKVLTSVPENETVRALFRYDIARVLTNAAVVANHTENLGPDIHTAITRIQQCELLQWFGEGDASPIRDTQMLTTARTFRYFQADYLPPDYPPQRERIEVDWHEIVDLLEAVEMINDVLIKRASWVSSADHRRFHFEGPVDGGWYSHLDPDYPYEEYRPEPYPKHQPESVSEENANN
ncbi:hypothetical protein [Arthrobacter sp. SLBN-122]|uniref:hypothetical protein n=1 Tax=Arthrobacter sp. SLBN-122 TaxID=2768455 RepID=UPI0011508B56|nr:hypothetical protein [Arthrobacter sp. SLBN-122]TQJ35769.1 hypothetical protein FBY36_3048 [Arthrobacter sp. SLBN-122]